MLTLKSIVITKILVIYFCINRAIAVIFSVGDYKMAIDYKLIGERIKQRRKASGITQECLAEWLEVSVGYVSQLERGITKISLDTLGRIAEYFSEDISFFVSGAATGLQEYAGNELSDAIAALNGEEKRVLKLLLETYTKVKRK